MNKGKFIKNIIIAISSCLLALFILGPVIWTIISSITPESELLSVPPHWLPHEPSIDNYIYIFTGKIPERIAVRGVLRGRAATEARYLPLALANSVIVATSVTIVNLLAGGLSAYAYSRVNFKGKNGTFIFILGSRLLPPISIIIPYFVILKFLGLLNQYLGLILVYLAFTLPFTIWLLTTYFNELSPDIEEAGLIDGCNRFQVFLRIVLPIAAPGLIAASAFSFMFSYNEFLFATLIMTRIERKTIPAILGSLAVNPDISYSLLAACSTVALVPSLFFALIFRKYITRHLIPSLKGG